MTEQQQTEKPSVGQVWRHRYYDNDPRFIQHRHATVCLLSKNDKGGWLVEKLTNSEGKDCRGQYRNVRIKEWNLTTEYELVAHD